MIKTLLERSFQSDDESGLQQHESVDEEASPSSVGLVVRRIVHSVDQDDEDDSAWYVSFLNCLLENRPCVFPAEFTDTWRCRRDWVDAKSGGPSWTFLARSFGEAVVPIANCKIKYYNSQLKTDIKFAEFVDYWRDLAACHHDYDIHDKLYLKDWHFVREFPNYDAYKTPFCFEDDWLNEFWRTRTDKDDDYRFVYMGPKGSWTPLHTDVFDSYSWSANICGLKKWIMFPPDEGDNLRDVFGNIAYDVLSPDMDDESVYANYSKVKRKVEFVQQPGEVIFVPSRWYHQVHNLEDTISINHNWFNAFNVNVIWQSMKEALAKVQEEIEDCKDMDGWDDQCQLILKSTFGMDFNEFGLLLRVIASSRLSLTKKWLDSVDRSLGCTDSASSQRRRWIIEGAASVFDLSRVASTLKAMNETDLGKMESSFDLIAQIESVLEECQAITEKVCTMSEH